MKAPFLLALVVALAAPLRAAPAAPPTDLSSRFSLIGPGYKAPAVLPESIFNPFKIKAPVGLPGSPRKEAALLTDQGIVEAVEHRHVTGLLLASDPAASRVIIGDEIFSVGDTLQFFDEGKGTDEPLALGATIVLKAVGKDRLALEVSPDGENPRRLDLPLRTFWRP